MHATSADSTPPSATDVLDAWNHWQGAIDCFGTQHFWPASALRTLSSEAAQALAVAGVRPGDYVALVLSNTAAFPALLMALLARNATPVLLHAGTQNAELRRAATELRIPWVIHDFFPEVSNLSRDVFRENSRIPCQTVSVSVLCTGETGIPTDASLCGAVLHPTSGTYGKSRFCVRNQRVAMAEARNYVDSISCYGGIRVAATTPLSHAYAYGFCLMASLLTHSTLVLDPVFNPKRVLRRETRSPSEIIAIVPPMAKALARLASREEALPGTRQYFYAGAFCPVDIVEEFTAVFGVPLNAIYGTTETGAISTSYTGSTPLPGVGRALQNVSVRLSNAKKYAGLRQGAGEVVVRSTSMMQGYVGEVGTAAPCAGWNTQDIGYMDEGGAISLIGRVRDIINLGGMKVDPVQVEAVLRGHPNVVDAAVYPGLRDDATEYVQAAVQVKSGVTDAAELRQYCMKHLDAYKTPLHFHLVPSIPRTPSGKCLKIQCPEFPPQFILH